jgi:zinc transporter ZupT
MSGYFWYPFLASMLAAGVTTTGLMIISRFRSWAENKSIYFSSFAAGMLISVSLLHIVPESIGKTPLAPIFILIGYFSFHLFNHFVHAYICNENKQTQLNAGLIPLFGIGIHSFIDGIIYSIAFNVSMFTGIFTVSGMILHEFPEGIVLYVLLLRQGVERKKALMLAFLGAALTTPLGMVLSYPLISQLNDATLGLLLSVSGGALLYVGATHLLPEVEQANSKFSLLSLLAGVTIAVLIVLTKTAH